MKLRGSVGDCKLICVVATKDLVSSCSHAVEHNVHIADVGTPSAGVRMVVLLNVASQTNVEYCFAKRAKVVVLVVVETDADVSSVDNDTAIKDRKVEVGLVPILTIEQVNYERAIANVDG